MRSFKHVGSTLDNTVTLIVTILVISVLLVLLAITTVTFTAIYCIKKKQKPRAVYNVIFSIKDKPGSLAKALEVFKVPNDNLVRKTFLLHHNV